MALCALSSIGLEVVMKEKKTRSMFSTVKMTYNIKLIVFNRTKLGYNTELMLNEKLYSKILYIDI